MITSNESLTAEFLKEHLRYEKETGNFYWLKAGPKRNVGMRAGSLDKVTGYVRINLGYRRYQAHRLAWLYVTEHWPLDSIDHINRNRADNRWENLRMASQQSQNYNTNLRSDSTSGYKGITFDKFTGKWKAHYTANGKVKTIGRFASKELAVIARLAYEESVNA